MVNPAAGCSGPIAAGARPDVATRRPLGPEFTRCPTVVSDDGAMSARDVGFREGRTWAVIGTALITRATIMNKHLTRRKSVRDINLLACAGRRHIDRST